MKNDYGYFGKGIDGYVHYKLAFDRIQREMKKPSGRRIKPRQPSWEDSLSTKEKFILSGKMMGAAILIFYVIYLLASNK